MTLYFLGGGNMARAIISGLRAQAFGSPIFVANRSEAKNIVLQKEFSVETAFRLPENLTADDVLILAVKPQDMQAALADVKTNGALILSLAAGLEVATLANWLGTRRIVRVMPNTPCAIGQGISGLWADHDVSEQDKITAQQIMSACGSVIELPNENMMHAITAISGSGSAYVFYLLNALQTAAQNAGFNDTLARRLALETFCGAVALAAQSDDDFAVLQQNVTSKGGTTAAALNVFEQHGVANAIAQGAHAAATRSAELANLLAKS